MIHNLLVLRCISYRLVDPDLKYLPDPNPDLQVKIILDPDLKVATFYAVTVTVTSTVPRYLHFQRKPGHRNGS